MEQRIRNVFRLTSPIAKLYATYIIWDWIETKIERMRAVSWIFGLLLLLAMAVAVVDIVGDGGDGGAVDGGGCPSRIFAPILCGRSTYENLC